MVVYHVCDQFGRQIVCNISPHQCTVLAIKQSKYIDGATYFGMTSVTTLRPAMWAAMSFDFDLATKILDLRFLSDSIV